MPKNLTALEILLKPLNPSNQTLMYERKFLCNVSKKNKEKNKTTLSCKGILPAIFATSSN